MIYGGFWLAGWLAGVIAMLALLRCSVLARPRLICRGLLYFALLALLLVSLRACFALPSLSRSAFLFLSTYMNIYIYTHSYIDMFIIIYIYTYIHI